ncbi:MAG TPA: hypothetical protein VJR23_08570 [Candidatus Acidoferrales bacterium]|nr:hypothetical protein [Candidatus Acidoferrales bacterium]
MKGEPKINGRGQVHQEFRRLALLAKSGRRNGDGVLARNNLCERVFALVIRHAFVFEAIRSVLESNARTGNRGGRLVGHASVHGGHRILRVTDQRKNRKKRNRDTKLYSFHAPPPGTPSFVQRMVKEYTPRVNRYRVTESIVKNQFAFWIEFAVRNSTVSPFLRIGIVRFYRSTRFPEEIWSM